MDCAKAFYEARLLKLLVNSISELPPMPPSRLLTVLKALRQLGFTQVALNGLYRLGLKTGYYRRRTIFDKRYSILDTRKSNVPYGHNVESSNIEYSNIAALFSFPSREQILQTLGPDGLQSLLTEADEIVAGKFRQFGAELVEINLAPPAPPSTSSGQRLGHWTDYETHRIPISVPRLSIPDSQSPNHPITDPKMIWEPARFGWAFVLGRAWHVSGDEKYAETFWKNFETFQAANPPYLGPNWMSGQEVGIRLMAFAWAAQIFAEAESSTAERLLLLSESITHHALRIPPTLIYARSQNNNHLLTEAAALYTASFALPGHPRAAQWQRLGRKWLTWCFTHQIDAYGEYVQHSTNYHRLMLQTALWVRLLENRNSRIENSQSQFMTHGLSSVVRHPSLVIRENLALVTHWLLSLLDPDSGRVPNLGANDGALLFPFSTQPFDDFRPVAQAAARAFLRYNLPAGPWDEMSLWFGASQSEHQLDIPRYPGDHLYAPHSWAYLRAVRFKSRPSHADQLHFDLWWRGLNIAQDAGTYLYNAPPPWDNRLTSTIVHNTVSVDGQEQMTRAGRFLYLDWADATSKRHFETGADFSQRVSARTYAYTRLGIRHDRTVTVFDDERWRVEDELLNIRLRPHTFRLHWLLPDWEWEIGDSILESGYSIFGIRFNSPYGWITLRIQSIELSNIEYRVSLVRAGEYLHGSGPADPVRGWVSPTYAQKVPALSLAIEVESAGNVNFSSEFSFPTTDDGQ
jgi:hypothetical protein